MIGLLLIAAIVLVVWMLNQPLTGLSLATAVMLWWLQSNEYIPKLEGHAFAMWAVGIPVGLIVLGAAVKAAEEAKELRRARDREDLQDQLTRTQIETLEKWLKHP